MDDYLGEIRYFAGNFAPLNWRFCNGDQLAIAQYDTLYALIGTTYGGDGVTTFNLPDFRGRVGVGTGQGLGLSQVVLGQKAGTETVTLIQTQLPAHTHAVVPTTVTPTTTVSVTDAEADAHLPTTGAAIASAGYMNSGSFVPNLGFNSATPAVALNPATVDLTFTVNNGATGGSQPHDNMQPYLAVNFIICVLGIFPSRN
ncbi:phage tail protein [Pedobacter xixiisoli]|uniref:Microcystin-dependent protein n=1 Tax=Pedobacter xixiisoli TaxID=1476464 RepID=A0A285ZUR3_9SPHI|nr:tail fiber protein [Pedobacter xixiisoli]SOD13372.1 Microcystin-dependent protein [Pedobacter xixiisoli]